LEQLMQASLEVERMERKGSEEGGGEIGGDDEDEGEDEYQHEETATAARDSSTHSSNAFLVHESSVHSGDAFLRDHHARIIANMQLQQHLQLAQSLSGAALGTGGGGGGMPPFTHTPGRGLHSSTSQLKLSRFCHKIHPELNTP
jgi:hypothetical protein